MKQPLLYLSIATSSLIFLGCTPIQRPAPTTSNIEKTPKKSSLEEALDRLKKEPTPQIKKEPTPSYIDPTENKKEVEHPTTPIISLPEVTTPTKSSKTPTEPSDPYGEVPKNYRDTIRAYLNKRADSGESIKYIFSRPKKAQKRYGSWQGWMVQVDVLKRNGKGVVIRKQPYTILFEGSKIVEDIAQEHPKSIKMVYPR
jgi:hypothetical protein